MESDNKRDPAETGPVAVLVLGMTAAVFLITVMTIFSTSCLQAMIRQEIEETGRMRQCSTT